MGVQDAISRAVPKLQIHTFERLLAVTRGGLVPTALIGNALNIRDIDCIGAISYTGGVKKGTAVVNRPPSPEEFNNPKTLIVDDITDTGATMIVLSRIYPNATKFAVVAKPLGIPHVNGFVVNVNQDVWVNFPWEDIRKGGAPLHEESGLPS